MISGETTPPIYVTSHIKKRHRSTKADVEALQAELYRIVGAMHPMTVRQVFYQASVRSIAEKSEAGYLRVQRNLTLMRKAGELPYSWLTDNTRLPAQTEHV
jgi:hypothetical protein